MSRQSQGARPGLVLRAASIRVFGIVAGDVDDHGGGGARTTRAAAVVAQLRERHCTQEFPLPFAQAPFSIHIAARASSVM